MTTLKTKRWGTMSALLLALVATLVASGVALAQVAPPEVNATLAPGEMITIDKKVTTPDIPPKPEICFLSDSTGSMKDAIANVQADTKFEGEVYVLSKEEGGRHSPFFSGYRPQFYFRTTDVTGTANLVEAEMCMPGDNVRISVEMHKPVALDDGVRFAIREGGRTVGSGVVTKVIE